jgi:hypothetical protein
MVSCCECSDEPSGSCAMELVSYDTVQTAALSDHDMERVIHQWLDERLPSDVTFWLYIIPK